MLAQSSNSGKQQPERQVEYHMLQPCFYCKVIVYWMRHRHTGKIAPIDTTFGVQGDVLVNLTQGTFERLTHDEHAIYRGWLHTRHEQTCTHVDEWRGREGK